MSRKMGQIVRRSIMTAKHDIPVCPGIALSRAEIKLGINAGKPRDRISSAERKIQLIHLSVPNCCSDPHGAFQGSVRILLAVIVQPITSASG